MGCASMPVLRQASVVGAVGVCGERASPAPTASARTAPALLQTDATNARCRAEPRSGAKANWSCCRSAGANAHSRHSAPGLLQACLALAFRPDCLIDAPAPNTQPSGRPLAVRRRPIAMRPAARALLSAARRRADGSCDALERSALAPCAAILQGLAAPWASPQRCLASAAPPENSDSSPRPAATPAQPAAAGAAAAAASTRPRKSRSRAEQFSPGMEDFVKQMFAADLDALPSDQAAEAAVPGAMSAAAAPAAEQPPQPAAAAEPESAVATAALAAAPVLDAATAKRREKKLKRLLGEGSGGRGAKVGAACCRLPIQGRWAACCWRCGAAARG